VRGKTQDGKSKGMGKPVFPSRADILQNHECDGTYHSWLQARILQLTTLESSCCQWRRTSPVDTRLGPTFARFFIPV
jgi:hypothetical protein